MAYICEDTNAAKTVADTIKTCGDHIPGNFKVELDKNPFSLSFWVRTNGKDVAHFRLVQQQNCCGIVVSTDTWVIKEYQGQKLAQEMLMLKEALAKVYGYSCMMATVNITGNPAEVHILEKFGWTCVNRFVNSRTKNTVGIFTKNL